VAQSSAQYQALSVLKDEHRSLAAVLHGMGFLMQMAVDSDATPNFAVLRAMVYYLDAFSERSHHPKEDAYLFHALRQRTDTANSLLAEVECQHAEGAKLIRDLEQALIRYQEGGAQHRAAFAKFVKEYSDFHWNHMRMEEDQILPLAEKYLTPLDWERIATAFCTNHDPLAGLDAGKEFEELFSRIVQLAPAPIGLG
jgi:hemerythrin-like domain-containing protein